MITLNYGCTASEPSVNPKDWQTGGRTLLKKTWYIQYYFRDPKFTDRYKNGKFVILKKMNSYRTLADRREATRLLLENELDLLQNWDYNPITGYRIYETSSDHEIAPTMPFIEALTRALRELSVSVETKRDIKSVIKYIEVAACKLHYDILPISGIQRKHIKALLSQQGTLKVNDSKGKPVDRKWTDARYNVYWKYLHRLFEELIEMEAVEYNPVSKISKKSVMTRMRPTLTKDERHETINVYLKKNHYTFYRFCQIFFHSGGRMTELLRLRVADVDLTRQRYKTTVMKGKNIREDERTIKDIALPFWIEILEGAKATDYVIGRGLKAGALPTTAAQITRRWRLHVKEKLGITKDLYSLKHSNLDEIAALLDDEAAQKQAGHTTSRTTETYLTGKEQRDHERLKKVNNEL